MAERAVVRARLRELIVTIVAGDRKAVVAAWNAAFPPSSAPADGSGDWPWQRSDLTEILRNLYEVVTAAVWVVCAGQWPSEGELEVLTKDALAIGGWRSIRITSDIVAAVVPKSKYSRLRIVSLHNALVRSLLHEIVDRPLSEPVREPPHFMTAVATLLTARLLACQPDGAGAAFDRVIAVLDDGTQVPDLAAEAARVFYRVYAGFPRAKVTAVEQQALRDFVGAFLTDDVPRVKAAFEALHRTSTKEHREQIDRAFMDGAIRMFATPDGRVPTREADSRAHRSGTRSGGARERRPDRY